MEIWLPDHVRLVALGTVLKRDNEILVRRMGEIAEARDAAVAERDRLRAVLRGEVEMVLQRAAEVFYCGDVCRPTEMRADGPEAVAIVLRAAGRAVGVVEGDK